MARLARSWSQGPVADHTSQIHRTPREVIMSPLRPKVNRRHRPVPFGPVCRQPVPGHLLDLKTGLVLEHGIALHTSSSYMKIFFHILVESYPNPTGVLYRTELPKRRTAIKNTGLVRDRQSPGYNPTLSMLFVAPNCQFLMPLLLQKCPASGEFTEIFFRS
jgi:hypothetical protein